MSRLGYCGPTGVTMSSKRIAPKLRTSLVAVFVPDHVRGSCRRIGEKPG